MPLKAKTSVTAIEPKRLAERMLERITGKMKGPPSGELLLLFEVISEALAEELEAAGIQGRTTVWEGFDDQEGP